MLAIFVPRIKQNKLFFTSAESTVAQASIRTLLKCGFDNCTSVDLAVVQASNQRLYKRLINGYNRRIDG